MIVTNREGINAQCNHSYMEFIKNKVSHKEALKHNMLIVNKRQTIRFNVVLQCYAYAMAMPMA